MGFGESGFLMNSAVLNFWMFASFKKDLVNPDLWKLKEVEMSMKNKRRENCPRLAQAQIPMPTDIQKTDLCV